MKKEPFRMGTKIHEAKQLNVPIWRKLAIKLTDYDAQNLKEAEALLKLQNHSNVVEIIESQEYEGGAVRQFYIAMELCHHDNLQDHITKNREKNVPFDFDQTMDYTKQLVAGIVFIHENDIIHRDLKPHNVLFSVDKKVLKIADFGLSKQLRNGRSVTRASFRGCGTDGYRAPETYKSNIISKKSDIYSLGLVVYIMWSNGKHPFGPNEISWGHYIMENGNRQLSDLQICRGSPKRSELHDLLEDMLQPEPKDRPAAKDVEKCSFFRTMEEQSATGGIDLEDRDLRGQETVPKSLLEPRQLSPPKSMQTSGSGTSVAIDTEEAVERPDINIASPIDQRALTPECSTGKAAGGGVAENPRKLIGPEGGVIHVGKCKLTVPRNALNEATEISITAIPQCNDIPVSVGYQAISPVLDCSRLDFKFQANASIILSLNIEPAPGVAVDILWKKDLKSQWVEHQPLLHAVEGTVKFDIDSYGLYVAALKINLPDAQRILFQNFLFYEKAAAALYVLTFPAEAGEKAECMAQLEEKGYKNAFPLPDNIALKPSERMSYELVCQSPSQSEILPKGNVELNGATIISNKFEWRSFKLSPSPSRATEQLSILYIVGQPNVHRKESIVPLDLHASDVEAVANNGDPVPSQVYYVAGVRIQVRKSTRQFFESHLSDDTIYRIYPDRTKGKVLIMNNEYGSDLVRKRVGSEVDTTNMVELWQALGFEVVGKTDLSAKEILRTCNGFANEAVDVCSLVVILMTHGGENQDGKYYLLGEDEDPVLMDDVVNIFTSRRSPHLQGIPKIFLFQACRGANMDRGGAEGYVCRDSPVCVGLPEELPETSVMSCSEVELPERADMLIAYPSQTGYVAYRNNLEGSWLINAIANVFMKHARDTHVLDMLTMVNAAIAKKVTHTKGMQISNQESYLTKKMYLFPGWPKKEYLES